MGFAAELTGRRGVAQIDQDGDGEVDKEEFLEVQPFNAAEIPLDLMVIAVATQGYTGSFTGVAVGRWRRWW